MWNKMPSRIIEFKITLALWLIVATAVGGSMAQAASGVLEGVLDKPEVEKKLEDITNKGINSDNQSGVAFDWEGFADWVK
jgi:hypothetical protein